MTLTANGRTLQEVDSGRQDHTEDPNYAEIHSTPAIPFDTPHMIFNDLNTEWGQLLQPTQNIMQAFITLPREEVFLSRFRGHEDTMKPL